ncbi:MAG TPA: amino acid ABC transporter substrate-binding protein [Acetobacterium sp.]|uniref:Transporter substrate-binding domain-containing protein n=3 Tax=Acetobacterium wieringae TaxID=52694 RepID=A0A5D0WKU4_9FIRM|nr:transporter substrate-binding domain-containing protein [Acetobacterium wieringae]HAZ06898.1 amino acid ABC transporter substrate-binding protein [Acetobacterium sp.]
MKKLGLMIMVLAIAGSLLMGCSTASKGTESEKKMLTVGMELAYPPFETKDEQGNPSGISVDLAYALGEYLGRPVQIENTNWDGLIPSLQTGKVDVVISSMTITDERKDVVDFSVPYAKSYLALLVNKNANINQAEDLNQPGKVVDVKKGTTGNIYATKNLTNATVNALSSETACVTEVTQGKADAFIYDQLTIYRQNKANPDTTKAILIPFQDSESWGIAVNKGNEELLIQIDSFIEEFKAQGGFVELTDKYLKEEKQTFDALGFPWFFD